MKSAILALTLGSATAFAPAKCAAQPTALKAVESVKRGIPELGGMTGVSIECGDVPFDPLDLSQY